jgi:hypothetical protein
VQLVDSQAWAQARLQCTLLSTLSSHVATAILAPEYVKTVVMTQTNVAQPTMISSMFNPVYSSGNGGIPSASAFSAHVGQGSQSSRVSASDASSTSSAAYAVYDGAASGNLQWSLLKMIGTAMLILVAILA